jgi:hypothetical protein
MFRTYALAPITVRRLLSWIFWRFQLLVTASFVGFAAYLGLFAKTVVWEAAITISTIIALAYFFVIFFHYRQQIRLLYSIRYEIDGSKIVYRQVGKEPLPVSRADIVKVHTRPNGLWIETATPGGGLFVPFGLSRDGDTDLRETLSAWTGTEIIDELRQGQGARLWILVLVGSLLVLLFANSLFLVIPAGALVLFLALYNERRFLRKPGINPGVVRMYNIAFSFFLFVILMKACLIGVTMAMGK